MRKERLATPKVFASKWFRRPCKAKPRRRVVAADFSCYKSSKIDMITTASPLVTTYLEMRSPEQLRLKRCADARFHIREQTERDWRFNRDLYFRVGEQWHWIDKRPWTDEQWREYAAAPELRTFAAYYDNALAGYYELRRESELTTASLRPDRRNANVEIAYFGLLPEFIGRSLGGALLTSAIEEAWGMSPKRVWVHTCNRDHPQALANYQARGMVVYKIEESAD